MSNLVEFHVPNDDILRELDRVQVLHSQLDHVLRLVIKRTLGIFIDHSREALTTCAVEKLP